MIAAGDLGRLLNNRSGQQPAELVRFGDLASSSMFRVSPDVTMREAADAMAHAGRIAVPVTNDDGLLVGLVTVREILGAQTRRLRTGPARRVLRLRLPFFRAGPSANGAAGAVR